MTHSPTTAASGLIRFRAANHLSISEEVELNLASAGDGGEDGSDLRPASGAVRVAGVFGANASGKSNLLRSMHLMRESVRDSCNSWLGRDWRTGTPVPVQPFALDPDALDKTSLFEADLVADGTRWSYGFAGRGQGGA